MLLVFFLSFFFFKLCLIYLVNLQDRLYHEIREVCGSEMVMEEHLPQLPYLNAVFHETLRKYSPAPIVPLRYAHEDTQLGGYDIPAGTQVSILSNREPLKIGLLICGAMCVIS